MSQQDLFCRLLELEQMIGEKIIHHGITPRTDPQILQYLYEYHKRQFEDTQTAKRIAELVNITIIGLAHIDVTYDTKIIPTMIDVWNEAMASELDPK